MFFRLHHNINTYYLVYISVKGLYKRLLGVIYHDYQRVGDIVKISLTTFTEFTEFLKPQFFSLFIHPISLFPCFKIFSCLDGNEKIRH